MTKIIDGRTPSLEEYHQIKLGDIVHIGEFEFEVTRFNKTGIVISPKIVDGAVSKRQMIARFGSGKKL